MSCEFLVAGDVEKARKAIAEAGGGLEGIEEFGRFVGGGVEGFYRRVELEPATYLVTITKKPWLVSCSRIVREVTKFFEGTT